MTELCLIRHGQTDWNLTGRWQGQTADAPGLNYTGRAQTLAAREQLRSAHFSAIYSSDLLRSRQTAELLAEPFGLTVNLEPRLREMNLGMWEGMFSDDINVQFPQELEQRARNPLYTHAPNGESPREVADRVILAMNEIISKYRDESILIVSHGIPLAFIICHAGGFLMEDVYEHIPENALPNYVQWLQ